MSFTVRRTFWGFRISGSSPLLDGYDEPEILPSSGRQICLTGADAGQPEPCERESKAFIAGYKNIADTGRGRIRKYGEKVSQVGAGELNLHDMLALDAGFGAFSLSSSNFKRWHGRAAAADELEEQINLHVDHLLHERKRRRCSL
jgi:hypothetical protein